MQSKQPRVLLRTLWSLPMISITSYRRAANWPSKDVHAKINQATPSARVTGGTHDGHADPGTWRSVSVTLSAFDVTARYQIWNSLCLAAAFLRRSRFASSGRVRNTSFTDGSLSLHKLECRAQHLSCVFTPNCPVDWVKLMSQSFSWSEFAFATALSLKQTQLL